MSRLAYIVSAMVLSAAGPARAESEPVELPLYVVPGLKKEVGYTREIAKRKEVAVEVSTGEVRGVLEVLSVQNETFNASWTTTSVRANGEEVSIGSPVAADFFIGIPLEFEAGYDGTPLRITNRETIQSRVTQTIGALTDRNYDLLNRTRELFASLSDEAFAQLFLKAPSYLSLCQGTSLNVGEEVSYETELANPLGGKPLQATGTYLLKSAHREQALAAIEWNQSLDPEKAKASIVESIIALDKKNGTITEDDGELGTATLDVAYRAECAVDMNDGWVKDMTYTIKIGLAGQGKTETWHISTSTVE